MSETRPERSNQGSPVSVCVLVPNYYRSSGVNTAIKRLVAGSEGLPVSWSFVECGYGNLPASQEDRRWVPADGRAATIDLMSLNPLKLLRGAIELARFLRRNAVQVLHVHHRRLAIVAGAIGRIMRVPVIYTGHLVFGPTRFRTLRFVDVAVAINESVKADIAAHDPVSEVRIISNAAAFAARSDLSFDRPRRSILCLGRLGEEKNHRTLLRAWSTSTAQALGYRLTLAGEGPLRADLEAYCRQLGIEGSVDFLGFREDAQALIDRSAFVVLPSLKEGQPVVVLEAAARGRPVLVSDIPGSRDCVAPETSLPNKVVATDADALADALSAWVAREEDVDRDGLIFRDYWKSRADQCVVAQAHVDLYNSVIRLSGGASC